MSSTPRPTVYADLDYLGGAGAYANDIYQIVSRGPLFDQLTRQEIEVLCDFMHCFAAKRDTVLLKEGEAGDHLVLLLTGEVTVNKRDARGQSLLLRTVTPGFTLGEMSLIDGEPRYATCIATEPMDIAVMTRAGLNELLLTHPRLGNKFLIKLLQIVVERLRETGGRLLANYVGMVV